MNPLFSLRLPQLSLGRFLQPFALSVACSACLPSSQPEKRSETSAPLSTFVTADSSSPKPASPVSAASEAYALHLAGRDLVGPVGGMMAHRPAGDGRFMRNIAWRAREPHSPVFDGPSRILYDSNRVPGRIAHRVFMGMDASKVARLNQTDLAKVEARGHQLKSEAGNIRKNASATRLALDLAALAMGEGDALTGQQRFSILADASAMSARLAAEELYRKGNGMLSEIVRGGVANLSAELKANRILAWNQHFQLGSGLMLIGAGASRLFYEFQAYSGNVERFGSDLAWEKVNGSNVAFSFFDVGYGVGSIVYWKHLMNEAGKVASLMAKNEVLTHEVAMSLGMRVAFRILGGAGGAGTVLVNYMALQDVLESSDINFQQKTYLSVLHLLGLLGGMLWFGASMLVTVASAPLRQKINNYAFLSLLIQGLIPWLSSQYGLLIPLAAIPVLKWYQRSKQETSLLLSEKA